MIYNENNHEFTALTNIHITTTIPYNVHLSFSLSHRHTHREDGSAHLRSDSSPFVAEHTIHSCTVCLELVRTDSHIVLLQPLRVSKCVFGSFSKSFKYPMMSIYVKTTTKTVIHIEIKLAPNSLSQSLT